MPILNQGATLHGFEPPLPFLPFRDLAVESHYRDNTRPVSGWKQVSRSRTPSVLAPRQTSQCSAVDPGVQICMSYPLSQHTGVSHLLFSPSHWRRRVSTQVTYAPVGIESFMLAVLSSRHEPCGPLHDARIGRSRRKVESLCTASSEWVGGTGP